jgi:predicted dehydrogenase
MRHSGFTTIAAAAAGSGLAFTDFVRSELLTIDEAEPLKEELRSFLGAVRDGTAPRVPGEQGARALTLAERILASIGARPGVAG